MMNLSLKMKISLKIVSNDLNEKFHKPRICYDKIMINYCFSIINCYKLIIILIIINLC